MSCALAPDAGTPPTMPAAAGSAHASHEPSVMIAATPQTVSAQAALSTTA